MKIIEHGGNPYRLRCVKCRCLFEYVYEDVVWDSDVMGQAYVHVKCPECKFHLSPSHIPPTQ